MPFYKYKCLFFPQDVKGKGWGRTKFIPTPKHNPALFHKIKQQDIQQKAGRGEEAHILTHWQYVDKLLSASKGFLFCAIHLKLLLKAFWTNRPLAVPQGLIFKNYSSSKKALLTDKYLLLWVKPVPPPTSPLHIQSHISNSGEDEHWSQHFKGSLNTALVAQKTSQSNLFFFLENNVMQWTFIWCFRLLSLDNNSLLPAQWNSLHLPQAPQTPPRPVMQIYAFHIPNKELQSETRELPAAELTVTNFRLYKRSPYKLCQAVLQAKPAIWTSSPLVLTACAISLPSAKNPSGQQEQQ